MKSLSSSNALPLLALLFTACVSVFADDDQWGGTLRGKGTDIGQLLFDQWSFSYAAINSQTNVSFFGATGGNAISQAAVTAVTDGFLDFASAEQPLQTFQKNYAKQDIIQYPVAAVPLVFVYNLPYGSGTMMDVTNQTTQLVLDGNIAQQIWIKNLTNWRDPRLLALQTPEVQALLPNANITLVVRSESCSATTFIQGSLRNFSTSTWPFGSASQTWSSAFRADSRVLTVRENSGVAALVAYTPNSIGYVTFAASVKNARYAAMINFNGDLVRTPDLTPALEHPYAIQSFQSSSGYVSSALLNSRAANAWPMGGYTFVIFRSQNTSYPCERRREMLLFFNWILGSDFEQRRMGVYGFQSLGRTILDNVLADLRATPKCYFNESSPVAWSLVHQHTPEAAFKTVLGANLAMLGVSTILFILYISDKFSHIAASARIFKAVLFSGGVLNFIGFIYFYKVPDDDSVCQARLWLSAIGFSMIFSSLACRGYQIVAVSRITNDIAYRVPHLAITVLGNFAIVGVQIVILAAWSSIDPFVSQQANVNDLRRTAEVICRSESPMVWWTIEIVYAVLLLLFCLVAAYLTWDLKHMVRESKWMSISIYNAVVVLGVSVSLHSGGIDTDDSVFWSTGTVLFLLNSSIMVAMFGPKVYRRMRHEVDSDDTSATDSKHPASNVRKETHHHKTSSTGRTISFHSVEPNLSSYQSPRDIKPSPSATTRKDAGTTQVVFSAVNEIMSQEALGPLTRDIEMTSSLSQLADPASSTPPDSASEGMV